MPCRSLDHLGAIDRRADWAFFVSRASGSKVTTTQRIGLHRKTLKTGKHVDNSQHSELKRFNLNQPGIWKGSSQHAWTFPEPTARQRLWGLLWLCDPATCAWHRLDGISAEITAGILGVVVRSCWVMTYDYPHHLLRPQFCWSCPLFISSYLEGVSWFWDWNGVTFFCTGLFVLSELNSAKQIQKRSDFSDSFRQDSCIYLDLPELHIFEGGPSHLTGGCVAWTACRHLQLLVTKASLLAGIRLL